MDLRKQLLLKKPLSEISLNGSNVSAYESATEDSDSESFYYSFTDTSNVNFDDSSLKKINNSIGLGEDHENSLASSPEDKNDDTVIQMVAATPKQNKSNIKIIVTDCGSGDVPNNDIREEIGELSDSKNVQSQPTTPSIAAFENEPNSDDLVVSEANLPSNNEKNLSIPDIDQIVDIQEPDEEMAMVTELDASETVQNEIADDEKLRENVIEAPTASVDIHFQDPNKSLLNPFTLGADYESSPAASSDAILQKKSAKKSATKIPVKTHLYSPLQRKSIDRNTKIIIKPTAVRRTIYETRSTTLVKKPEGPTTSISATSLTKTTSASKILKPTASKIPPKITSASATKAPLALPKRRMPPSTFKCTVEGCKREFRSGFAFQDHMKSHNGNMASTSASNSSASLPGTTHKCRWCDKKFEISCALITHMIESCTKISFAEKRKLIAEQEKNKPASNKRKSMFVVPEPAARKPQRSPTRRQTIVSRKSVTPKKTMKCHVNGCGQLFTDVLAFANHMVSHNHAGVTPAAKKT